MKKEDLENFAVFLNSKGLFYKKVENANDMQEIVKAGEEYAQLKLSELQKWKDEMERELDNTQPYFFKAGCLENSLKEAEKELKLYKNQFKSAKQLCLQQKEEIEELKYKIKRIDSFAFSTDGSSKECMFAFKEIQQILLNETEIKK